MFLEQYFNLSNSKHIKLEKKKEKTRIINNRLMSLGKVFQVTSQKQRKLMTAKTG